MKNKCAASVGVLAAVTLLAGQSSAFGKLKVATSVAPITDIVRHVAGDAADVTGVIPEGRDSHTYEPAPSDAKILSDADVIIMNGLHLETRIQKLAAKVKKPKVPIFELGEAAITKDDYQFDFSFPREKGNPNPHLWVDVAFAGRYAELTRDFLSRVDPTHAAVYAANTTALLAKLSQLDAAVFNCVKSIPADARKLVTYHDSFAYFALRYGMSVIAAVQPADFSEPGPKDVASIIEQLRREKVPAIFGSEVFPSPVLAQIAKEAGAQYITDLRDDELPGDASAPEHTYIGMMVNNLTSITKGLGGDANCVAHIGT